MISLRVLPTSDPNSFPSEKDFQELGPGEIEEWIVAWFFHNFEDPVHNTPHDGREGGYQYIWGGPYDTADQVDNRFSHFVPADVRQAAIEQIEQVEGPEWTVSYRRVVPDADEDDDSYHADLTNDSPDWFLRDQGRISSPDQARVRVARQSNELLAELDKLPKQSTGIGHNNPPEAIDLPVSSTELGELRSAVIAVHQEAESETTDIRSLSTNADVVLAWVRKVGTWAAAKADMFIDSAAKSAGTAAGTGGIATLGVVIARYLSPQHATIFEAAGRLAASVADWVAAIMPGF